MSTLLIDALDAVLPQTQCGLCSFGACRPYAEAMARGETTIDRCPPGGIETLQALAALLHQDATPYLNDIKSKAPSVAFIRESECIGCTKCIQACPVDAIVGTAKKMHTILTRDCTGCELCLEPCPVDCIEMIAAEPFSLDQKDHFRKRYQAHQQRLNSSKELNITNASSNKEQLILLRQNAIQDAITRVKSKKKKR